MSCSHGRLSRSEVECSSTRVYDAVGNWDDYDANLDLTGGFELEQSRDHDADNEIYDEDQNSEKIDEGAGQSDWADPIYDDRGNMICGSKPGADTTALGFAYDGFNRLIEVWQDDGDGILNGTETLLAEYTYDALNRRVTKTAGSTTIRFIYNGGAVIEERDGSDILLRSFVYGGGVDNPIAMIGVRGRHTQFLCRGLVRGFFCTRSRPTSVLRWWTNRHLVAVVK